MPGYSAIETFNHHPAQVMSHSDTIKKILIAVGAVLLMASNAFAETSREYLQTIDLNDLCIMYPENHQGFWVASVRDPDDYFHTVTVGSYIGKNFGRIMKISNDTVEVIEIIEDGVGNYVERPLTIQVGCRGLWLRYQGGKNTEYRHV